MPNPSSYDGKVMVTRTFAACFCAWMIPGAGHIFLNRWRRGLVFLAVISSLFGLGLYMDGRLFDWGPGFFGLLKFVANLAIGLPYLAGQALGLGAGQITAPGYEYGNTYLYTAGLLNMLLVVDTFDISLGRKP